jgi:hypothetical protein
MNRPKWIGFVVLLLLLAAFGWFLIPAHVTSIWMDWEFTDWVSPVANRLHNGARLYTYGLHSPMPPLPYVLVRILFPGGATWIDENFLDYSFRAATVLLLYWLLSRRVGVCLAFAACLATTPVFLSFGKTMLYDSLAQFLVAATGGFCAALVESQRTVLPSGRTRPVTGRAILLGACLGMLLLAKQSTGVGATIGVCLTLVLLPAEGSFGRRCLNICLVGLSAAACVCLLSLVFARFWSFSGMIHDVFLTGTEPKGGPRRMFNNLARYAFYLVKVLACAGLVFWIAYLLQKKIGWRDQRAFLKSLLGLSAADPQNNHPAPAASMLVISLVAAASALAIFFVPAQTVGARLLTAIGIHFPPIWLLNLGLAACLCLAAMLLTLTFLRQRDSPDAHPLAPFVLVFFCAAVFHNLSVTSFRWAFENNPLIALALVFLFSPFVPGPRPGIPAWPSPLRSIPLCLAGALLWVSFFPQLKADLACTESWPEIRQLAGARLRPHAGAMRELVRAVRQAAPNPDDTVLLLPNDPNVEAWFERPRPAVSSTILFTDQYWDRYVDADFAALQKDPPKVIVIGPRNFWRPFSQIWHWRKEEGLIRLVDRVQNELLPVEYNAPVEHRILFGTGADFMDVYVRKEPPLHP